MKSGAGIKTSNYGWDIVLGRNLAYIWHAPSFVQKTVDNNDEKSLYYHNLSKKRP